MLVLLLLLVAKAVVEEGEKEEKEGGVSTEELFNLHGKINLWHVFKCTEDMTPGLHLAFQAGRKSAIRELPPMVLALVAAAWCPLLVSLRLQSALV